MTGQLVILSVLAVISGFVVFEEIGEALETSAAERMRRPSRRIASCSAIWR